MADLVKKPIANWTDDQKKLIKITFEEIQKDKEFVRIFAHGGRGSGKSRCIAFICDVICRNTPGINFLVARRSFEALRLDTFNILKHDPGILDASKGYWTDKGKTFQYHAKFGGSRMHFEHLENSESVLGPTYGGIWIEQIELCDEDDFRLVRACLRQFNKNHPYWEKYKDAIESKKILPPRNYMFLSANPRPNWVQTKIIKNKDTDFILLSMKTKGNKFLPEGFIDENESAAYKKRYYDGEWESLAGLCYPEFTSANIVDGQNPIETKYFNTKMKQLDFSELNTYIILDPGVAVSKTAVMFAVVLPDKRVYVFDEISVNGKDSDGMTLIPEIASMIHKKIAQYNMKNPYGIIDYAANQKQLTSGATITQQFQEHGLYFSNAIKHVAGAHEIDSIFKINSLFKQKKIMINIRCAAFLRELELFSWKTDRNGIPNKDEPKDADNDFCDCLKYLINAGPVAEEVRDVKNFWTKQEVMQEYMKELFTEEPTDINPLDYTKAPFEFGL